jgi:hypothetical protein
MTGTMIGANLILMEGLTGVGKSTAAQALWLHFDSLGYASRWVYEHDVAHPIWPAGEQLRLAEAGVVEPALLEDILLRWRNLARACAATKTVTILDGAYFQATIGFLLAMNLPDAAIVEHARAVDAAIAEAGPALVYLRRRDVAEGLSATFADRPGYQDNLLEHIGKTPYARMTGLSDVSGLVRFYERWVALVDQVRPALRATVLLIDADDASGRDRYRRITDALALPEIRDVPASVLRASRFVGRYRDVASSDEIIVSGTERGLYLGERQDTALIPRPGDRFHMAAVSAELSFGDERCGLFQSLHLSGNLPGLSPVWKRVSDGDESVEPALEASEG